jgi:hypothetical protein
MKLRTLAAIALGLAGTGLTHAASTATVEFKGSFVKITAVPAPQGAPQDRELPLVLYVRKASIERVAIIASPRTADFIVELVTTGPISGPTLDERGNTIVSVTKTYYYHFLNEPSASAFCESILSDQNG